MLAHASSLSSWSRIFYVFRHQIWTSWLAPYLRAVSDLILGSPVRKTFCLFRSILQQHFCLLYVAKRLIFLPWWFCLWFGFCNLFGFVFAGARLTCFCFCFWHLVCFLVLRISCNCLGCTAFYPLQVRSLSNIGFSSWSAFLGFSRSLRHSCPTHGDSDSLLLGFAPLHFAFNVFFDCFRTLAFLEWHRSVPLFFWV